MTNEVARELARIRRLAEPPPRLAERIVAALAIGEATSSALAISLGVPQGSIQDALGELVRRGRVIRSERGPGSAPTYRAVPV